MKSGGGEGGLRAVTRLPQKLTRHSWHYQPLPPEDTPLSPEAARVEEHLPEVGGGEGWDGR